MDPARMRTAPVGSSLPRLAEQSWDRLGDQLHTVFEGQRCTAAELGERSRRLATGVAKGGGAPGGRGVLCMANCLEVGIAYHAIWRAGAVVTPVLFLLSEDELHHVLIDSEASVVLVTPEFLPKVLAAGRAVPTLRAVVLTGQVAEHRNDVTVLAFGELEDEAEA